MSDLVLTLKALADESRFRIINLLLTHDLCVGALAGHLNISKAAVSQHLQILRKAGLVSGEKRGYWTHYRVDRSAILQIAEALRKKPIRHLISGSSVTGRSRMASTQRIWEGGN